MNPKTTQDKHSAAKDWLAAYRSRPLSFFIYMMSSYSAGAMALFFPIYYRQTAGFGEFQIGAISALSAIVIIASQLFWGRLADRAKTKNRVLTFLLLMMAVCFIIYPLSLSFAYVLLCASLYSFFNSAISFLTDAIVMEPCKERGWDYGRIRMAGSIGYGATSFLAGVAISGQISWQFAIGAALSGAAALLSLPLQKVKGHQSGREKVSPLLLLRNRNILLIFVINLMAYTSLGYYYSFYGIHFTSPELGGGTGLLGFSMLLACVAELPFLFLSKKIVAKLTTQGTLLLSTGLMALRWLLTGLAPTAAFLVAVNAMHGVSNIVFQYCTVTYIHENTPPELRATGQSFVGIVSFGGSRVIGGLLGGFLAERMGIGPVFYLAAGLNMLTLALFAFLFFGRKPKSAA